MEYWITVYVLVTWVISILMSLLIIAFGIKDSDTEVIMFGVEITVASIFLGFMVFYGYVLLVLVMAFCDIEKLKKSRL